MIILEKTLDVKYEAALNLWMILVWHFPIDKALRIKTNVTDIICKSKIGS